MSRVVVTPQKTFAALSIIAVAFGVTGCGPSMSSPAPQSSASSFAVKDSDIKDNDEFAEICINPQSGERVDDDECDGADRSQVQTAGSGSNAILTWLLVSHLMNQNRSVPAVGQVVPHDTKGTNVLPSRGSVYTNVPASGAKPDQLGLTGAKKNASSSLKGTSYKGSGTKSGSLNNKGSNSNSGKSGSNSNSGKGGFGSGSKSGGGTSGG